MYFWLAIVFRFFQGVGDVTIQTCIYSVLTNTFSENRERVLGFGETAAGLGLMMGPIIGGELYVTFGYFWCYILLAGFLFCDMLFTALVMPSSINFSRVAAEEEVSEEEK